MASNPRFTFMADVVGDAESKGRFVGIASSCNPDRRKQALSKKAFDGMMEQGCIPLVVGDTHEGAVVNVKAEVGLVERFWTEGDNGDILKFEGKLDPSHPDFEFWCSKLDPDNEFSFSYKTSIGGWVPKDAIEKTYKAGEQVEILNSFRLDHLLFCRGDAAVNQDTAIERGMATPDDWQGAIFYAMAEATKAEDVVEELPSGAAEVVAVDNQGGDPPPEIWALSNQIRFLLDRLSRQTADDPMPYIIGVYADGTVLYEICGCEYDEYDTFMCKWAWDGSQVTITDPVKIEVNVEVTRTYTTEDGSPIQVFNADPLLTDEKDEQEILRGWALARHRDFNAKAAAPSTAEEVADGGTGMACAPKKDKKMMNKAGWVQNAIKSLADLLSDDSSGAEEATGMAEETSAVEETTEEMTTEAPTLPDGLTEIIAKAVSEGVKVALAEVLPKAGADEAAAEEEVTVKADETATEEAAVEETTEETVSEDGAAEESATEEETGKADTDEPVMLSKSDVDGLNATMKSMFEMMAGMKTEMEGMSGRVVKLESRGMANGKTSQAGTPGAASATPETGEKKSIVGGFILGS